MPPSRKKGSRGGKGTHPRANRKSKARGTPKKSRSQKRSAAAKKRSAAAKKGWATRRKRIKAEQAARRFVTRTEVPSFEPWEHDREGWEPSGGWQGDQFAEEIAYMTHEEKIEWLEWLAEQLDTTISELFEMMGSP